MYLAFIIRNLFLNIRICQLVNNKEEWVIPLALQKEGALYSNKR